MKAATQQLLPFRQWGGARAGAGRKRTSALARVSHESRPEHLASRPIHVTLRARHRFLRTQAAFPAVRAAFVGVNRRRPHAFRIVEFSVQENHIHLIAEANNREELSSGLRSLSIRVALKVNRRLQRRGSLFADRWHARELMTPREVRNALVYVLANHAKHSSNETPSLDLRSSSPYFEHFLEFSGSVPARHIRSTTLSGHLPHATARTWLLRSGWQKWGLISIYEHPKRESHRASTSKWDRSGCSQAGAS